ncbi:replication protein A 32 kDa subunit A-like [Coffea arabica]|uniref:Replication protein A 32 kDa subunit A-like n=1 Tax=Coffea arabica TaxID=13443 RepID=A0A6P6SZM7_COFAR|nr:replication protein A 32 kDa subunit A-like [Coffea arabica]
MFSSSQIDVAGGGFSSSQATDSSRSSAKSRDAQPMVPVTVKQISDAVLSTDDKSSFKIDGVDVKNVMLVGMAFNKSEKVTDVQFEIDDGTGRIGCLRWINDAVDTKEVGRIEDGKYVRVHGLLRALQGKKQLQVFAIRPLNNYDELSSHFLACIHYHSFNTRRNGVTAPSQVHNPISAVSTPVNGHKSSSSNQFYGEYSTDGLKGIDKMVIEYLEQPSSVAQEKGVHRNEIAQHLKIPLEKILETIESLESEGLIYSTIDECHYKSTTCG